MSRILIIEDEAAIRRVLGNILKDENDQYEVSEAEDGVKGLSLLGQNNYDLVLCDIKMPGIDGMEVLQEAVKKGVEAPFLMISGHGDIDTAVECMKMGAFDYIPKPPDLNRLLTAVRNALDRKQLVVENKTLRKKVERKYEMIGQSDALSHIQQIIDKVAPTDARVLITGGNGTGKELVAHAIHSQSQRASGPLIEVNCAAIPSELIESELFGHEKGAFTSANKLRKGKFETAIGGTLFLDEIGDMSLSAQAKVLRALQENRISRVGSDKQIAVDVRVIAATNKNLELEIKEGRFREDLYHRLAVILIKVPALNERKDDIPLLADHFAAHLAAEQGTPVRRFTPEAVVALQNINWTGNIREFRNVIERLTILCGEQVTGDDVKLFAGK